MKWYFLPPLITFLVFLILGRLTSGWIAIAYAILIVASLLAILLLSIFYYFEKRFTWSFAWWKQLLIGLAALIVGYGLLPLLVRL